MRRLFKTAILFVGKDYYCHALWDQYIKFEYSQQNWSSLANIYLEVLRHPTDKLHEYYDKYVSIQDCFKTIVITLSLSSLAWSLLQDQLILRAIKQFEVMEN